MATPEKPEGEGWVLRRCERCHKQLWLRLDHALKLWLCNPCWASEPLPGPPNRARP